MISYRPEQLPLSLKMDPVDREIEEKLTRGPRCTHCGFNKPGKHGTLCVPCVKKLVHGLILAPRRTR